MVTNSDNAPVTGVADAASDRGLDATWDRAAKIWWSLMWRTIVFGMPAGLVAGVLVGKIGGAVGVNTQTIALLGALAGVVVAIPVGIWVVHTVLRKSWSDFRIILMAK